MRINIDFTNVYSGEEHTHRASIDVEAPPSGEDALQEWADENLYPHTGDGNAADKDAGYFVKIVACEERPDLTGREFDWC